MTFKGPRVGGGTDEATVWVGGSSIKEKALKTPKSILARRYTDFKSASHIEVRAKEGLPEGRRMSLDERRSKISLTL